MDWIKIVLIFLLGLFGLILIATYLARKKRIKNFRKKLEKGLNNGWEFEKFVAELFKKCGYKVTTTKGTHDFGADIIVQKRGSMVVLQAKYLSSTPSTTALDEALAAAMIYGATEIGLVTNTQLSDSLKEYARKIEETTFIKKVILIGRKELERVMNGERLI
ncbi:restriction endonuclease [Pseudothermotoga thermarum]|uniref:Restriction endonuclease n=1 Tax=Pseudothermotoga thermarum DSM 5069 TaxID=688269 RepID=F7YYD1_9THEM|nr:restriction endonuclease [Pseudothermotoga thermarum]AEH50952.1 restriction endonuclease [Pseudothermotoga thermarum DSM 5069]